MNALFVYPLLCSMRENLHTWMMTCCTDGTIIAVLFRSASLVLAVATQIIVTCGICMTTVFFREALSSLSRNDCEHSLKSVCSVKIIKYAYITRGGLFGSRCFVVHHWIHVVSLSVGGYPVCVQYGVSYFFQYGYCMIEKEVEAIRKGFEIAMSVDEINRWDTVSDVCCKKIAMSIRYWDIRFQTFPKRLESRTNVVLHHIAHILCCIPRYIVRYHVLHHKLRGTHDISRDTKYDISRIFRGRYFEIRVTIPVTDSIVRA